MLGFASNPYLWLCSGTAWRAGPVSSWCWVSDPGRTGCKWRCWRFWVCRRSRTGRPLRPGRYASGCRRSCTARSKTGWWWCGWGSPPRGWSASAAASCTSPAAGNDAPWRAALPDWTPALRRWRLQAPSRGTLVHRWLEVGIRPIRAGCTCSGAGRCLCSAAGWRAAPESALMGFLTLSLKGMKKTKNMYAAPVRILESKLFLLCVIYLPDVYGSSSKENRHLTAHVPPLVLLKSGLTNDPPRPFMNLSLAAQFEQNTPTLNQTFGGKKTAADVVNAHESFIWLYTIMKRSSAACQNDDMNWWSEWYGIFPCMKSLLIWSVLIVCWCENSYIKALKKLNSVSKSVQSWRSDSTFLLIPLYNLFL